MEDNREVIINNENSENIINKEITSTTNESKDQSDNRVNLNSDSVENVAKLNKLSFPKRKFAIIHGYNGHAFSGNQK